MQTGSAHPGRAKKANLTKHDIISVDEELNRRVYSLYGLTEEEIKIVEVK
jgi:hypothetical protein